MILPDEINVPITIAACTCKLLIFHSTVQLFGKHFKCKVLFISLSSKITKLQKFVNLWKLFAKEHENTLLLHGQHIYHSFISSILMQFNPFRHKISITDIKLILFNGETLFYDHHSTKSCIYFFTGRISICFVFFKKFINFSYIRNILINFCTGR